MSHEQCDQSCPHDAPGELRCHCKCPDCSQNGISCNCDYCKLIWLMLGRDPRDPGD